MAFQKTKDSSDLDLIDEIAVKSSLHAAEAAFVQLYQRYHNTLTQFLANRIDPNDVDDLAQNIWVKIWAKADQCSSGSFRAWLFAIATNQITDHYRRNNRRRASYSTTAAPIESLVYTPSKPDWNEDDQRIALNECMERLEDREREIVAQRLLGHSYGVIANQLALSEGNARKVWHRAKKHLRQSLAEQFLPC